MPHNSLTKSQISEIDANASLSERAEYSCRRAKALQDAGELEAAREALSEFWPQRDKAPIIEGLEPAASAEVLLRVGVLAGWLGEADQTPEAQERAKNLISRSIQILEGLEKRERVAEARTDLESCYWREGAFDEASMIMQ